MAGCQQQPSKPGNGLNRLMRPSLGRPDGGPSPFQHWLKRRSTLQSKMTFDLSLKANVSYLIHKFLSPPPERCDTFFPEKPDVYMQCTDNPTGGSSSLRGPKVSNMIQTKISNVENDIFFLFRGKNKGPKCNKLVG